jgi:chromosomal replication initiator protein
MIAARVPGNVKQLERSVRRVYAYAALTGDAVTEDFIDANLSDIVGGGDPVERRLEVVFSSIEERFGIRREDLVSKRKTRSLSAPRGVAILLLRNDLSLTFKEVGRLMGERSHTSVYLIYKKFEGQAAKDPSIQAFLKDVGRRILTPGN